MMPFGCMTFKQRRTFPRGSPQIDDHHGPSVVPPDRTTGRPSDGTTGTTVGGFWWVRSAAGGAYVGMAGLLSLVIGGNMASQFITQKAVFAAARREVESFFWQQQKRYISSYQQTLRHSCSFFSLYNCFGYHNVYYDYSS